MKTVKYLCKLCGQTFELPEGTEPVCPICGATKEHLEVVKSEPTNKYAGTRTVLRPILCSLAKLASISEAHAADEFPSSPPRTMKGLPSTISCTASP